MGLGWAPTVGMSVRVLRFAWNTAYRSRSMSLCAAALLGRNATSPDSSGSVHRGAMILSAVPVVEIKHL